MSMTINQIRQLLGLRALEEFRWEDAPPDVEERYREYAREEENRMEEVRKKILGEYNK